MSNVKIEKPKSFLKERVMRFKVVMFIKKNIFVFSLLLLFSLSLLVGLWNVKKIEIINMDKSYSGEQAGYNIRMYMDKYVVGRNYFSINTRDIQRALYSEVANLKWVKVEKTMPNKMVLFVKEFEPKYVLNLEQDSCKVLSREGYLLFTICENDTEKEEKEKKDVLLECCREFSNGNNLILFQSKELVLSSLEYGRKKLLLIEDIQNIVKVIETSSYEIVHIEVENDILEIEELDGRKFKFSLGKDIDIQLRRYIIVLSKIRNDSLEFQTLDLRFERPVLVNN